MRIIVLLLTTSSFFLGKLLADDMLMQDSLAIQFKQHLVASDTNNKGYVTKDDLTKEIQKSGRSEEQAKEIAGAMITELDLDHNGQLSLKEIDAGARATAIKGIVHRDSQIVETLMEAIQKYKIKNKGILPNSIDDLIKTGLISNQQSICTLADGTKKQWIINPTAKDPNAVLIFSPSVVDNEGQYMLGLVNGRVIGLQAKDLDMATMKSLNVYPNK
jgi:hypothetical protein